jgi:hypothetical protein
MPTRGKTTFQKRQKEMARKDKQQRKAERRAQRKLDAGSPDRTVFQDAESVPELDQDVESPPELDRESEPQEI